MVQPAPKAGGAGGEDVAVLKRVNQHASASTAEGAAHSESARDLTSGRNSPPTSRVDVHGEDDKGSDERPKGRKFYDLSGILKWWEALVILLTIAPMAGYTIVSPYQQAARAELGCGPVCIGSITSVSSALGLFGAPLVGALSDHQGRRFALVLGTLATTLSFVIQGGATSLTMLWISVFPSALFAHNFTITKAVVSDLSSDEERAATLGKLGLAAGLGFMSGPVAQLFISDYRGATLFATFLQVLSLGAIYLLPEANGCKARAGGGDKAGDGSGAAGDTGLWAWLKRLWAALMALLWGVWEAIKEVGELAVAAPPAAKAILFLRFALSMGFHVFYTVMQVLLKERYNFGPNDYSNYFAFIGLVYGASQILSKYAVNSARDDPTRMVMACTLIMGLGRYGSAITHRIELFYIFITLTILALGILNNTINTTVTRIGSGDKVGGLMGVLDTSEKLAGVVGPTVGGLLYSYNAFAPVLAVCLGYVAMSVAVSWAFPRYVVPALKANAASKEKAE